MVRDRTLGRSTGYEGVRKRGDQRLPPSRWGRDFRGVAEPFWSEAGGPIYRHGSTYAGHPTCCAAKLANIALLERDGLLTLGREQEQALLDALT